MKSLLFISLFLLFGCTGESNFFSSTKTEGVKYIWQVDSKALILDLISEEDKKNNIVFQQALDEALSMQKSTGKNLVALLEQAYSKYPVPLLAPLFSANETLFIQSEFSNKEVSKILQEQVDHLIEKHIDVFQKRMAAFNLTVLEASPIENTDRFFAKVAGADAQTKTLMEPLGKVEFWELHKNTKFFDILAQINDSLKIEQAYSDSTTSPEDLYLKEASGPLFDILSLNASNSGQFASVIAYAKTSDVEAVTKILNGPIAKKVLGVKWNFTRFMWSKKATTSENGNTYVELYAIDTKYQEESLLNQSHILNSLISTNQHGEGFSILISMTPEGTIIWKKMTEANVGKQLAIVLDDQVYSAPMVNEAIPNGKVNISGGFDEVKSARDLSNTLSLKAVLPSQLILIEESIYKD
jgi:SecD/SecF fusion protein